jgi:N-acetylglucosaminyldiphosphoundecaprenol N-acetyl-beta-D-mannosaminyltransferase
MPAIDAGLACGQVIGLRVTVGALASISGEVIRMARRRGAKHVCVANVHMLVTARRDPELRRVLEGASVVTSDGMPLVRRLRSSGFPEAQQVRGPDLMMELCRRAAEERLPVYFYGGDEVLMAKLKAELVRRLPNLQIAGCDAAPQLPVRPAVDSALVERIRDSGARIVFVGLGCPKQEFWMGAYSAHLNAVLIGVGQAFAVAAGQQPEAPLWMRERCLEWLYRLCREPRRLGPRYLVTNSLYLVYSIREAFTSRF